MPDPRARDPRFPDRPTHPDFIRLSEAVQTHDAMAEQLAVNPFAITGVDEKSLSYFLDNRVGVMVQRLGTRILLAKAMVGAIWLDGFALGKRFAEQVTEDEPRVVYTLVVRDPDSREPHLSVHRSQADAETRLVDGWLNDDPDYTGDDPQFFANHRTNLTVEIEEHTL